LAQGHFTVLSVYCKLRAGIVGLIWLEAIPMRFVASTAALVEPLQSDVCF